jgi:DNA-directed RNA polymerase specialized sigma24 family protein
MNKPDGAGPRTAGRLDVARIDDGGLSPSASSRSQDGAVDGRSIQAAVAGAFMALRPEYRLILLETFYRGRSVTEAGEALGIPAATVRSRTLDGLRALKLALGERGLAPERDASYRRPNAIADGRAEHASCRVW